MNKKITIEIPQTLATRFKTECARVSLSQRIIMEALIVRFLEENELPRTLKK